ncbi:MAG TPA: L-threonylcarbamoyladenylate synthase [Candidatus Udaeobacter sp.]
MKTVVSTDRIAAVELLRNGNVVALPTETVYGLASKALDSAAVAKIFEAKDRPRFNPLIVHLPNREALGRIVDVPAGDRQLIHNLADSFWPGPFTMVLPKCGIVPDIATAGLDTVAVRLSAHPVFAAIVGELDEPLAAPSANRFGRISPTTAHHVLHELDARIPLIIDGGPTEHGIESTVVAVRNSKIAILRRGPITREQLLAFAEVSSVVGTPIISSPGQLPSHYAPKTPLRLVDNPEALLPENGQRVGLLAWNRAQHPQAFAAVRILSDRADLREGAANLFRYLRELDALGLDLIIAERVPSPGLGAAIMDRLERASHQ